jgi:hypothetical protein
MKLKQRIGTIRHSTRTCYNQHVRRTTSVGMGVTVQKHTQNIRKWRKDRLYSTEFSSFHVLQPVGPVGTLVLINTAIGNCSQTETDVVTKMQTCSCDAGSTETVSNWLHDPGRHFIFQRYSLNVTLVGF